MSQQDTERQHAINAQSLKDRQAASAIQDRNVQQSVLDLETVDAVSLAAKKAAELELFKLTTLPVSGLVRQENFEIDYSQDYKAQAEVVIREDKKYLILPELLVNPSHARIVGSKGDTVESLNIRLDCDEPMFNADGTPMLDAYGQQMILPGNVQVIRKHATIESELLAQLKEKAKLGTSKSKKHRMHRALNRKVQRTLGYNLTASNRDEVIKALTERVTQVAQGRGDREGVKARKATLQALERNAAALAVNVSRDTGKSVMDVTAREIAEAQIKLLQDVAFISAFVEAQEKFREQAKAKSQAKLSSEIPTHVDEAITELPIEA